jgi:short-subunit dehydrogenase
MTRTAIITGASSGIGAAFARQLAAEGYNLLLHGRREIPLQSLARALQDRHGIQAQVHLAELADPVALAALEARVRGTSDLAVLVNNAGFSRLEEFHEDEIDAQEEIIRVHVLASVRLAHAAISVMKRNRDGAIINVSSVAAFTPAPRNATYCATKAYLNAFSESLHLELRPHGIRVQALCPGFTRTEFHERMGIDTSQPSFRHFMAPEVVVRSSLRALRRGTVLCVPGLGYKAVALGACLLPRRLYYWLASQSSRHNPIRKPGQ